MTPAALGHRSAKCQDGKDDDDRDAQDAPRQPTIDRRRFVARNPQRRKSIAKQVANTPSPMDEQRREERRQGDDEHRSEDAPWIHHACTRAATFVNPPRVSRSGW